MEIHYGVVQIEEQWMVISEGLRSGPYRTREIAEQTARRMAAQAAGQDVQLHFQNQSGELHHETQAGED